MILTWEPILFIAKRRKRTAFGVFLLSELRLEGNHLLSLRGKSR